MVPIFASTWEVLGGWVKEHHTDQSGRVYNRLWPLDDIPLEAIEDRVWQHASELDEQLEQADG